MRAGRLLRRCAETLRLMIGIPDYERYVAQVAATRPGQQAMSYEEFFRERQARRYAARSGSTGRCC